MASVVSDSVQPHRWQPTRLSRPWDSPGKNTGVGCHFLLQCMKVKSESEVIQSYPTPRNPMDCSPPGSSIHGIFQARVLEWGAIAFSEIEWISPFFSKFLNLFLIGENLLYNIVMVSIVQQCKSSIIICISWRRACQPTPVFLPRKAHRQRSLASYTVHGVAKSQTQLNLHESAWTHASIYHLPPEPPSYWDAHWQINA